MTSIDYEKQYWQYARDVLDGDQIAGLYIRLACERMMDFAKRDDIFFDYADVDKKIKFIQKMKHTRGKHAKENFILLPYQKWIIANIFGWKNTETKLRITKNALLLLSRKAGKTFLAASIALVVAICDGQSAPEIAFIANSAKQATIAFEHCTEQAKSLDPKEMIFKRFRHDIRVPANGANINILSSDTSKLDGRGDTLFIQDEGHEAKTLEIWNVLKTGQGAVEQPLGISISTAGFHVGSTYPLYSQWEYCTQILNHTYNDDSWFSAIYQLDEDDDWTDENVWIKANPSLGQTVGYDYMREQIRTAIQSPSNEVSVKTKNLNMWCQSQDIWLKNDLIQKVTEKVDLSDYAGEEVYGGVDLSVSRDLTATAICIPPNPDRAKHPDKFIFKTWVYIPEQALEDSSNREYYKTWIRSGYAYKTPGNIVDYDFILKNQLEYLKDLYPVEIGYDPFNAPQYVAKAEESGLPMAKFGQGLANFNGCTKFFEMLVCSEKCIIDKNPAVEWMFANVELIWDHKENCKPWKANSDPNNKIDGVISMLEGLGCYFASNNYNPDAWVLS